MRLRAMRHLLQLFARIREKCVGRRGLRNSFVRLQMHTESLSSLRLPVPYDACEGPANDLVWQFRRLQTSRSFSARQWECQSSHPSQCRRSLVLFACNAGPNPR